MNDHSCKILYIFNTGPMSQINNDVEPDIIVSSEVSHILCNIRLYDYLPTNRNLRNYHMYTCVKNNKDITVGWLVVLDLTAL